MRLRTFRFALIFIMAAAAAGSAFQAGRTWPLPLQQVPEISTPLSPEDSLKTFSMPPGYHAELVASEPLVIEPVQIDFDADGRMWVVEMPGFMQDLKGTNEHALIGRIVVLEDTNGDGKMDKRTVFQDGLDLARWVKVLDRGVLVAEPPNLWLFHDTNGDLRADSKELVTNNYGLHDGNVEHNANGMLWGIDNWMHTANADIELRLKNGKFETRPTLSRGQWGSTQDETGRIYRNTNESALHVDLIPANYFTRHPALLRTRGSHESLNGENGDLNLVWPIRPTRGVNRGYQAGILRPDGTLARFTSVCAPLVFRGDRLPAELDGNVFVVDPTVNLVRRIILADGSNGLVARNAYADVHGEFLASTDELFRPVNLSMGPDGTLYVVDMYRGVVEHKGYVTEYLQNYVQSHKMEQWTGRGRIYRIVHDSRRRDTPPAMSRATPAQLVAALSHPNGWRRDMAQELLVERGIKTVTPALKTLAETSPNPRTRLHALWTLDGLDAIEPATVIQGLAHPSRDVRAAALRISERWLRQGNAPVQAAVLKLLDDRDWSVQKQLAATLGELPAESRIAAMASLLERHGDDPVAMDAALSGLHGQEAAVLERILQATADTPQRRAAITMLAATLIRENANEPAAQVILREIAEDARPAWQRSALLNGAEVALLSADPPGTPPRAAADPTLPCNTCVGGRGGPGGAPAFPNTNAPANPVAVPANRGGPRLTLTREPPLVAYAPRAGDLGARITSVLARVDWPGKPGAPAPIAPLSAAEQQRITAGHDVFTNACEACHGADGRGQPNVTPNLVGYAAVLGPVGVPVRVLLQGKEGSIGLMPAHGTILNDDQIAAVLSYIRRSWGNVASTVDPAVVRDTRAQTAGRTKPWTQDELSAIARPQP
ncbi:MAG TPA: c-type cytochrome [Vicinamibacterales bacterium]|nr:c-type cytochrome [Vicinamibacterales bacterium]